MQHEMNSVIWFLDKKNMILDTKIIILAALVKNYDKQSVLRNGGKDNVPINGIRPDR